MNIEELTQDPARLEAYLAAKRLEIERKKQTRDALHAQIQQVESLILLARECDDTEALAELGAVRARLKGEPQGPKPEPRTEVRVQPAPTQADTALLQSNIVSTLETLRSAEDGLPAVLVVRSCFCRAQSLQKSHAARFGVPSPLVERLILEVFQRRESLDPAFNPLYSSSFGFTEQQWRDLSADYLRLAKARRVLDWYQAGRQLSQNERVQVLSPVGAAQQIFYRASQRVGLRDSLSAALFDELRAVCARDQIYLQSINPLATNTWLEQMSAKLDEVLESLKDYEGRETSQDRRESLLADIEALVAEDHFTANLRRKVNRQRLTRLLTEAKDLKIPPSDPTLRALLMPISETMLKDQPGFEEFHREAALALNREQVQAETKGEDRTARWVARKNILGVGGLPVDGMEKNARRAFSSAHVSWVPATRKTGSLDLPQVKKSDVVIGFEDMMGQDLIREYREACSKEGKPFLLVKNGFGVKRMTEAIREYVEAQS